MSITREQYVEYWRSKFQDERDRNAELVEALDEKDDYDARLIVRLTEDNAKLVAALEKIAGRREYDPTDYEAAATYKRDEGVWTVDEYLADTALADQRSQ